MASNPSLTVSHLAVQRERDEAAVVAKSSVQSELVLSWLRLGIFLSWALASSLIPRLLGIAHAFDPVRIIIVYGYLLLAVMAIVSLRRLNKRVAAGQEKLSIVAVNLWPVFGTAIDFTMVALMHWRDVEAGIYHPDVAIAPCALFLVFAITRFSVFHTLYGTALAMIVFTGSQLYAGQNDVQALLFSNVSLMGIGAVAGWLNRSVRRMFVEVRQRDNLKRFLPPQVADRVLHSTETLRPAAREVTILFSDIRDFTTLSERLPPEEVLSFLDRYFGHMSQIVKGHDGIVNKFLGDGMLAVWGVPDRDEHHAEKALKAALDMRRKLIEFNEERAREGLPAIRMGIGIHTGMVAAGMLGGADQHEYTVIGDAVNLASRIEGLTKSLGVDLLVSESTWRRTQRFHGVRAGEERVKGRHEPVVVYTVEGFLKAG